MGGQFPEKTIRIFTDKYNAYSGKHNFLCNTGYEKVAKQSITLTFEKPGVYTFDKLKIVCQPMERITKQTEKLNQEVLTDIRMDTNRITGNISLSEPKGLLISVPYSKGFRLMWTERKQSLKRPIPCIWLWSFRRESMNSGLNTGRRFWCPASA